MKLMVLTVVSIGVFTANCRDLPDGRDISDDRYISDGPEFSNDGRVQNKSKLRGGSKFKKDIVCSLLGGSCVTKSKHCSGREVPSLCSGAKFKCCITVTLEIKVHDLETELRSMVVNLTVANSNLQTEMKTILNSKISNITIANSNMDLKIESLTSNLTDATSDMKNELQFIKVNLTVANSNLQTEMKSISNSIISLTSNLTIENSNMDLKIESLTSNLTIANSNMDLKIESLTSNFTDANSDMKNELQFIKENMTNASAKHDSKLDSIKEKQGTIEAKFDNLTQQLQSLSITNTTCPKEFFSPPGSKQCFKILGSEVTWSTARSNCISEGLQLAIPYDAIAVRRYIMEEYALNDEIWVDGKADGSNVYWQRDNKKLDSGSPLWLSGHGNRVSNGYCLALVTSASNWKNYPNQPYWMDGCTTPEYPLCELIMN